MKNKNMDRQNLSAKVKNSVALSGLITTGGLFVAKLLGLLYSMPLSSILGSDSLMSYYGTAYLIYSYILNVFTAGFPFAISTIVAKYTAKGDYRALKKVKAISNFMIGFLGFAGMALLFLLAGFMAPLIAAEEDIGIMTVTLRILSLAIFFVPILSSYRGFWEGRKEMAEYAFSQTFEQIFRVGFLLSAAYVIVYILNMDRVFALYAAVMSTSVAAVAGIVQIYFFDKKMYVEIEDGAQVQRFKSARKKSLTKELLLLSVPYLLTAVIGYADYIFNSVLLPIGLRTHGYSDADYSVILSGFNYIGSKLTSIPQVLSPGFAAALIPHITESLVQKQYDKVRRVVSECIGIVIFVGGFLSGIIAIYSEEACHILFYTSNLELSASVTKWMALEGFLSTLCPILSSLMIALELKKESIRNLIGNAIIKGIVMVPLIKLFGYPGAVLASLTAAIELICFDLYAMRKKYNIHFHQLFKSAGKILFALAVSALVAYGLKAIGLSGSEGSKVICLFKSIVNGSITMIVYFVVGDVIGVTKDLFHRSLKEMILARIPAFRK